MRVFIFKILVTILIADIIEYFFGIPSYLTILFYGVSSIMYGLGKRSGFNEGLATGNKICNKMTEKLFSHD